MEPQPVTRLRNGRYVIVGELGQGAQGTTFDAVDQLRGQPVAIKRFSVRGAASWKDVELAEREAAVLESLSHPSLPAHVEHFEEDGALYLVMQKIEGETLAARLKRPGAVGREDVVGFLRDVGGVLDYLHGRAPPVIHRDINPKNVVRRPDGSHALVDFGAVRDRLKPEGGSTVVGTFGYMAPEQFQGRALPASDVYSVGATALRMLTGTDPENLPHKGLGVDVRAALGGAVAPGLVVALERMLEIDPDKRARSVGEALRSLEPEPRDTPKASARPGPRSGAARDWEAWGGTLEAEIEGGFGSFRGNRRERRHMKRQLRRMRRHRRGPPIPLFVLGLNVAILVVSVVLGFAVPLVLRLLSIPFGRGLRLAASNVEQAGLRARHAMRDARDHLEGRATPLEPEQGPEDGARPPRVRIDDERKPIDAEGEAVGDDGEASPPAAAARRR